METDLSKQRRNNLKRKRGCSGGKPIKKSWRFIGWKPITVVYDIETVHTHTCSGFCFAPQNWAPMMNSAKIIHFFARELGSENSIELKTGKSFDFDKDFKCKNGREFGTKSGHDVICEESEYGSFVEAWNAELKNWIDELVERATANDTYVIFLAHNGEVFDHLHMIKNVPALATIDGVKWADSIPIIDKASGSQPPHFMLPNLKEFSDAPTNVSHKADDDVAVLVYALQCKSDKFLTWVRSEVKDQSVDDFLAFVLERALDFENMKKSVRNINLHSPNPMTFEKRLDSIKS